MDMNLNYFSDLYSYLKRIVSDAIERWPRLYRNVMLFKHRNSPFVRRLVTSSHDLVIEGYPRSANSFAVQAILCDNGWRDLKIATHTHSSAQVILGVRWNVPTLVLIRSPDDAVPSLLALGVQSGYWKADQTYAQKLRWIKYQTKRYYMFYRALIEDIDKYICVEFKDVVNDFGSVVKKLNSKYSTDYIEFNHNSENVEKIFGNNQRHLSPNDDRNSLKKEFIEIYFSQQNDEYRAKARDIYNRFKQQINK